MTTVAVTTGTGLAAVERPCRTGRMGAGMAGEERGRGAEDELLARVARRDVAAFERLYDHYGGPVYALALRLTGSPQVAQETAQEVFLSLWRGAGEFDPSRGSGRSWVLSLAHHKSVDAVRRMRRRAAGTLTESTAGDPASPPDAVVEEVLRMVQGESVRAALRTLSPEHRQAIVLAYYGGYTQQEIAQRLGIPLGTVKTRVRDGMRRLREILAAGEGRAG